MERDWKNDKHVRTQKDKERNGNYVHKVQHVEVKEEIHVVEIVNDVTIKFKWPLAREIQQDESSTN